MTYDELSFDDIIASEEDIYQVRSKAPGPGGKLLSLTEEQVIGSPSG